MQPQRGYKVYILDTLLSQSPKHRFDDPLAQVGPLHRWQRQRYIVKSDGYLHAGPKLVG